MGGVTNSVQLDRETYAVARARGHYRFEAARRAGSTATAADALCVVARRLEAEPEVQALIAAERERIKAETDDDWQAVVATMREDLTNENPLVRRAAAEFFGKVGGRFTDKHRIVDKDDGDILLPFSLMLPTDKRRDGK